MPVKSTRTAEKIHGFGSIPGSPGPNGNGSKGNGWHHKKDDGGRRGLSPSAYRLMMWMVLGAVVMMFAALSSVYIALSGGDQWQPIRMPRMLILSTGIILTSSVTMSRARRSLKKTLKHSLSHGDDTRYRRYLLATLLLGLGFLASQLLGWRQLVADGVYFTGRPHSSFFYLFTGAHGVHLLGGILGLIYLVAGTSRWSDQAEKRQTLTDVVALYWHFMDGVWVWLFLLLFVWR
jgi:cytochrome c oxidase subunit III